MIKYILSILFLFQITCLLSQTTRDYFWTDHSHYVNFQRNPETCSNVQYDDMDSIATTSGKKFRATIVSNGDVVELYPIRNIGNNKEWYWTIKYLDLNGDTITNNFHQDNLTYTFTKLSSPEYKLYETFVIQLYKRKISNGELTLMDTHDIFVVGSKKGGDELFEYNFDSGNIVNATPDEDGHVKITKYPDYSANGNSRSDLGELKQKLYDKCLYNAYYSNLSVGVNESEPRLGDGCVHIFNPPKDQNTMINEMLLDQDCVDFTSIHTYDFMLDPCNFKAIVDPVEGSQYYKHSITSKSQINIYPNHTIDDVYYYAFSSKIPEDFNEERMLSPSSAMGKDRWQVIAEFHQATWPYTTDVFPHSCRSALQLLYLGDDKVGIQFGLKDYNRSGFGPWDIEKGEWFDVIIHVKWAQVKKKSLLNWTADEGCLEIWINTGDGYEKKCMIPATNFWRDNRTLGSKSKNKAPFDEMPDHKTILGPNLENFNPPYLSLKTMRGAASGGTQGFDFRTDVFFDELRIASTLEDAALPSVSFIPDSLLDCDILMSQTIKSFENKGTNNESEDWNILTTPNPASNQKLIVQFQGADFDEEFLVLVQDVSGRTVYEERMNLLSKVYEIDTKGWSKGLYTLQAFSEDKNQVRTSMVVLE